MFASRIILSIARSAFWKCVLPTLFFWLVPCSIILGADDSEDQAKIDVLITRIVQLKGTGNFAEAIPIAKESVELSEKALGPEHTHTALSLNHLGLLYLNMRDYGEAEPLYQRALKIYEKTLGPDHPRTANTLANLADLYVNTGDNAKAEPLYLRALDIREKALGSDHPDTASSLNNLAGLYSDMGDYAKAEPLYLRALQIREKALGPDHRVTATSLNNLALLYVNMGAYSKAEPLYQRALAIREKALGPEHLHTALSLNNLGQNHRLMGEYATAESLYQCALKIYEKTLGPDHPDTATSLAYLAELYYSMGEYAKAEPCFQRVLAFCEKTLGPEHLHTAASLNNLGQNHILMGDYARGESLYQRALNIFERTLGPDDPKTATSLENLAELYYLMGEYAKAEPCFQDVTKFYEKALGPDQPKTLNSLNRLGLVHLMLAQYAKAESLFQRVLAVREKALGTDHPDTSTSLSNLARVYSELGDYAKAEPVLQRVLTVREKALGPDHLDTALSLNNLAALYFETGDYAKAGPLYQRALNIREKARGPDHPDTAQSLSNIAMLYEKIGDYAKAESLFQRALNIREKALGPNHPTTADSLDNLAEHYRNSEDYSAAEPLYERALKIREKTLGPSHPYTGDILNNLALLYVWSMRDFARAGPLYQRALQINEEALGPDHPATARSLNNLGTNYRDMGDYAKAEPLFQRALRVRETVFGPDHPETAQSLGNLARLKIDLGKAEDAVALLARQRRAEERLLSNILSFASEEQRLAFQKSTNRHNFLATLGRAADLAEAVLRRKCVVLDSLLEDRLVAEASNDPVQLKTIDRLRAAKQRLMQMTLEVPKDLSEAARVGRATDRDRLGKEVEQLEADLARKVAGIGKARRALRVTVGQVQSSMPADGTLIEFIRYEDYLRNGRWEFCYGAVLIGAAGEPKWVPLGNAAEIEEEIRLYQKSARGETDEMTLSTVLKKLQDRVWAPIETALPAGTKTVIVSPEAQLSFVSFATLLGSDGRFIGEKYSIRYVASGRDLLRETKPTAHSKTSMRVFANPDFAAKGGSVASDKKTSVTLRSIEMRDLQSISLSSLPGTAKESAELQTRATKMGWQLHAYLGPTATEAELRKVNSPRVLHLATHGFFLPEVDLGIANDSFQRDQDIPKGKLVNPMHRSGLAVAGAQTTLEAWGKGEVPPTENDGVVTAEEVGGLKLDETWLVVLSACDTGGGEARTGEGVMGLRRGFIQAGGQNLLMTLWPISDDTTVQIMLDFYDAAFKSGDAPQALADTQRDWLVRLRKERGLLAAVQLAGPFIMSSQGKP